MDNISEIIQVILGIAFWVIIVFAYGYYQRGCPKCSKIYCRKKIKEEIINKETTFETVIRKDTHKNAEGQITGTTERKEQARVEVKDINVTYQCSKCLYEWNTKIQKRDVL